jgi:hypothetical protein
MQRLFGTGALAALLALGLLLPAPAFAGQSQVVADCNSHGQLSRTYSPAQLRVALATMPADVKEYTDCFDVIQRALLAQLGGSTRPGGPSTSQSSGGSFIPVPLIVVLVLLGLGGAGAVVAALRRGGGGGGPSGT